MDQQDPPKSDPNLTSPLEMSSPGPLSPGNSPIVVTFPDSTPLGVTFDFNSLHKRLQIKSFSELPSGERGPAAGRDVLHPGLLLTAVNGASTANLSFGETAELIKSSIQPTLSFANPLSLDVLRPMSGPPISSLDHRPVSPLRSQTPQSSRSAMFAIDEDKGTQEEKKSTSPPTSPPTTSLPPTRNTARSQVSSARSQVSNASSAMADLLNARKTERQEREKRKTMQEDAAKQAKIFHPNHVRLEAALKHCEALGPALYVRAKNESYWYEQRRLLGGKFHSVRSVQKEKLGTQHKAMIYELKRREEDFSLGPGKKYLGLFNSAAKAYRACEKACEERDANPGEIEGLKVDVANDPSILLCTHMNVLIVSEKFRGLTHSERVSMVYGALLDIYWETPGAVGETPKNFCIRGAAVNDLPHMRHLGVLPFELMLDLRTPSQFQPSKFSSTDDERNSKSRTGIRSMGMEPEMKKLTKTAALRETIKPPIAHDVGGLHGHFYHDMTPAVKELVQEEYKKNQKLIRFDPEILESGVYKKTIVRPGQSEPTDPRAIAGVEGEDENGAGQNFRDAKMEQAAAAMKAASEALANGDDPTLAAERAALEWEKKNSGGATGAADKAASQKKGIYNQKSIGRIDTDDTEADIITKYQTLSKRVAACAKRLQRIYRRRMLPRIQRRSFLHNYAVLLLQKVIRGYYGREYVGILKDVMGIASVKIQACYRGVLGRRRAAEIKARLVKFAMAVQPIARGWIARTYAAWLRENWRRAVVMQRVVRGFNHRRKYEAVGTKELEGCFDVYAVRIQNIARGYFARCRFRVKIEALVFNKVLKPSVTVLQRIYRGRMGRRIGFQLRLERDAAAEIQRHCRGFIKRRWLAYVRWKKYERKCAILLQSHFKGWIDREIMRRRRNKYYEINVVIPSILRIQSNYRGYTERKRLAILKLEWFNANRIQMAWRTFMAMRLARELFRKHLEKMQGISITKIQSMFRGFWWRRFAYQKKAAEAARRLYACRIIMRGWIRYRDGRRYRAVKESWEVEQSAETLMDLDEERAEILEDLADIEIDIYQREKSLRKTNRRIKEIIHFNEQVALRIPKVDWEIDNPGPKDITQGWYDAFKDEYERLHNQSALAREEMRLCKCVARDLQIELDALWLEREDVQIDLDAIGQQEQQEFELIRRMQLARADRKKQEEWQKRVRVEKNKWKVDDVRKTVIRQTRHDLDEIAEKLKSQRNKDFVSTVSFWKKHDYKKVEKDALKREVRERRKVHQEQVEKLGIKNEAIRHTFDAVISGTLDILKGGTLDMRQDKNDLREDPTNMCRFCGRVYCECDLEKPPEGTRSVLLSQPNPWEDLDKFIETKKGGPENAEELRKLAIEKLEEAEEDIKRERKELKEAIEDERRKADSAREDRTMSMSLDLDDRIDSLIGGFMDEVGGGTTSTGGSQAKGEEGTATNADGVEVDVPRLPTSIMYIPIDDSVPQPYPSSGSQASSPNPTTVVIGTSSKTLNPKAAQAFLKAKKDNFNLKTIEKVIVLSNLGTERTGKFPWNLQNGLGGSLTKNGEGEQVLVEHFRKACKGNVPPIGTFVIKTGEGDVDDEAKSGGVLGGGAEDGASLLLGDAGKGRCDGKTLGMIVENIAEEREGDLGNVTMSVFGWNAEGGEEAEVKMLLEKLEGPEVSRIVIDVKDGGEAERRALILLSDVVAGMQRGGKTVTKVELDDRVGDRQVGVKFKESGAGWADKKGGGDKDDWGEKKEEEPAVVGGRGLRQGGVLCKVDGSSYLKKLIVSFSRYNYPKPWEKKDVPVKLMTEEAVIRELRRAVEEVGKIH